MKQISQKLKDGAINIINVPVPQIRKGEVLVRNIYSCISAGTESSKVSAARKGYIGKAKDRPQQAQQVFEKLMAQGPVETYRAVMKKLDAYSPLGYSSVGRVIDVAPNVTTIQVGDFVACGGGAACHAEIISVAENMCVTIPADTDFKQAAYNTLGAIAMQGVRQADLKLGESCAVIGLGLLGQLTCAFLKASGVKVIGIDIDEKMVRLAKEHSADHAFTRNESGIEQCILNHSNGLGCDAVIITAASSSLDPINFAGSISRKKGTIVVSGAVPTGFDREPHFYQKELTLKMSCSYGPGRYDPDYEEKGYDYPYAYVRWTEKRNMQAFQELISSKKIDISYITTHVFQLDDVSKAYDMIVERAEPFVGVLVKYDFEREIKKEKINVNRGIKPTSKTPNLSIGFIGAGSYAQGHLLPNIPKSNDIVLKGVMTGTSTGARSVAERFNFDFCTSNVEDIISNQEINTVFIATRHDTHGSYVIEALKMGKNVFVEKPLCLNINELEEINEIMQQTEAAKNRVCLMVGYNRRYSPLSDMLKARFRREPMAMTYRINAGAIPAESWIQDIELGGGRILGEVCHFVDYLIFINGSLPVSVYATTMNEPSNLHDTLSIIIKFSNGSIGNINYFSNGSKSVSKEYIEIYQTGTTAILNDYKELLVYTKEKANKKKLFVQDKGQKNEVQLFIETIKNGNPAPIPFEEIYNASLVTFKVIESLQLGKVVFI